jgi:hypothetical protein
MKIAVLKERRFGETRVATTPDTVKKLVGLKHVVAIESGAGLTAGVRDEDYVAAGASVGSAADALTGADIVFKVRAPDAAELATYPKGAALAGLLEPYAAKAEAAGLCGGRRTSRRDGIRATHHTRAIDGRAVEPGEPCGLSRRYRRRADLWSRLADDDDGGGYGRGGESVR